MVVVSVTILAFRATLSPQETAQAGKLDEIVKKAIAVWEKDTGIRVSTTAKREVEAAFDAASLRKELEKVKPAARTGVLSAGVTEYLGELRDSAGSRPLELADLKGLPPARAAANLTDKLAGGPVGQLVVTSLPPKAGIAIDGRGKGLTDKTFVVSAGTHQVAVRSESLSCSRGIDVAVGATVTFTCP